MLRGEQVGQETLAGRLSDLVRLKLALLRTEVLVGSPDLARIGLISFAMGLQTWVLYSPGHFRPATSAVTSVFVTVTTLVALAACLAATLPLKEVVGLRGRRVLAVLALLCMASLVPIGIERVADGVSWVADSLPYTNDGAVMDRYAAGRVIHGHDPYIKGNILPALASMNAPCITTTPLMDGQFRGLRAYPSDDAINTACYADLRLQPRAIPAEFESKYNYPAGSFLFILPWIWAGFSDMRFLYALALLGMTWYIAWRLPRHLRIFAPLLLLADVPVIALTAGGQPDPLYGVFLLVGYAEWRRRWSSPLFMGLAAATKQLAWFFLPFYLLLIARQFGGREALRRGGIILAMFLLLNGPFIVQSPSGYLASLSAPMSDPMFPLGIGIIALFVGSVLPMVGKLVFGLAELAAWSGGVLASARFRRLSPAAAGVLGTLPLFFAYRSLVNYFYFVPFLVLAIALADQRAQEAPAGANA